MRTIKQLTAALILMIPLGVFTGCEEEDLGHVTTQSRDLDEFDRLDVSSVGEVFLIPSSEYRIEITTNVELLPHVETSVVDGTLKLDILGNHRKIDKIRYRVFAPTWERLELNDVTKVYCYEGFENEELRIIKNDVSDVFLKNIFIEDLYIELNDVGDVTLSGYSDYISIESYDVGTVRAFELEANRGDVKMDGIGDVEVYIKDNLNAQITGIGTLYYRGSPDIQADGESWKRIENRN
jgi:hypothetical protein